MIKFVKLDFKRGKVNILVMWDYRNWMFFYILEEKISIFNNLIGSSCFSESFFVLFLIFFIIFYDIVVFERLKDCVVVLNKLYE